MSRHLFAPQLSTNRRAGGRPRAWGAAARVTAAAAMSLVGLAVAGPAFAHGDEGETPARELVLQAIAYIVNTPMDTEMVADKLTDAKESPDQDGVDVAELDQATQALDDGNLLQVRTLLERSIGARADLSGLDVRHVLQVAPDVSTVSLATGDQTGTQIVTDELSGRGPWTGTDSALVGIAAATATAGGLLSWRLRPAHSIHALRRRAPRAERAPGEKLGG